MQRRRLVVVAAWLTPSIRASCPVPIALSAPDAWDAEPEEPKKKDGPEPLVVEKKKAVTKRALAKKEEEERRLAEKMVTKQGHIRLSMHAPCRAALLQPLRLSSPSARCVPYPCRPARLLCFRNAGRVGR